MLITLNPLNSAVLPILIYVINNFTDCSINRELSYHGFKHLLVGVTFWADVSARNAHLNAVLLDLHLVAGARSDAGAVVHHIVI